MARDIRNLADEEAMQLVGDGNPRVYQAWVQRDGTMVPQPTFEVGEDGGGTVAVPDDLSEAEAVLVTREPRDGARAPSERPLIRVPL